MRLHRVLTLAGPWAIGSLLVLGCSGSGPDEQAIQPLPSVEQASEEADAGSIEPDGVVSESGAGDNPEVDGDVEVERSDADVAAAGNGLAQGDEVDVTVIPDVITEEYVEAVLAELEQLYADALRELILAGEPTIEVTDRLGSAFVEEQYTARLEQFLSLQDAGFPEIAEANRIRPRQHSVLALIELGDNCLYVETSLDVSGVFDDERELQSSFVELGMPDREVITNLNPTPWMIHGLPVGEYSQLEERRPCAS